MHQVANVVTSITTEPVVGATWSAFILFTGGALGALGRAIYSPTQDVRTQRTAIDMLVGGAFGMLLPAFASKFVPVIGLDILTLTALQQGCVALFTGLAGSSVWTTVGWRMGWIITPHQAATGEREKPEVGVIRGSHDAETAVKKYEDTPKV